MRDGEDSVEPTHNPTASPNESHSRHTPGPWHVEGSGMKDHLIVSGAGDELGYLYTNDGADEPTWFPADANARLIAAAPDLLAALKALAEACMLADSREELPGEVDGSLLDAAHAAIQQAEGR